MLSYINMKEKLFTKNYLINLKISYTISSLLHNTGVNKPTVVKDILMSEMHKSIRFFCTT